MVDEAKRQRGERRSEQRASVEMLACAGDFLAGWPAPPAHPSPVTDATVMEWFTDAFKSGTVINEVPVKTLVRWMNFSEPMDSYSIDAKTKLPAKYVRLSKAIATILELAPADLELA